MSIVDTITSNAVVYRDDIIGLDRNHRRVRTQSSDTARRNYSRETLERMRIDVTDRDPMHTSQGR
jgi:hypothetical protein